MANRGIGRKTFRYTSGRKRAAKNGYYGTGSSSYTSSYSSESITFKGFCLLCIGIVLFFLLPSLGILFFAGWLIGWFD